MVALNIWFPCLQDIMHKKPDNLDMMNALTEVVHQWEKILIALDLQIPYVSSLKQQYHNDYTRLSQGLDKWLRSRSNNDPTWHGLIMALTDLEEAAAIDSVQQMMLEQYHKYSKRDK